MKHLIRTLFFAVLATLTAFPQAVPQSSTNPKPLPGGQYLAIKYNYGGQPQSISPGPLYVDVGNAVTGSTSITVRINAFITTVDGDTFMPFSVTAPILVGGSSNQESVTPTAVSCSTPTQSSTCVITATFANTHGQGEPIASGTGGLAEAQNRAQLAGGGIVVVDQAWATSGSCNGACSSATIAAAVPYQLVPIEDRRAGSYQLWTPSQNVATALAAPATLTATTVGFGLNGANTTGGSYVGANTYHYCVAYVDIMGNEGPCSADFSAATAGTGSTNQIGFKAPIASTGAVGYTVYISLTGGSYNLTYQAPLTSTTCTLTKLETVTPACTVTNATYGQTGSNAAISALTVNSAPLHLLATTASTTAAYIGTPSGRTTYAYAPHGFSQAAAAGWTTSQQAYAISPAPATTVPTVLGTIPVPIGALNFPGATIRVCGQATNASGGTATIQNIEILWDAAGSNSTGAPVIIGQMQITVTQASSPENYQFCWTGQTTVSGAGVTAGSIEPVSGVFNTSEAAGTLHSSGPDIKAAAAGSLNLAGTGGNTQRIHIVWLHTTGTDAAGTTLQGLTVEVL